MKKSTSFGPEAGRLKFRNFTQTSVNVFQTVKSPSRQRERALK